MKFTNHESQFFKLWTLGGVRIMQDKAARYAVNKFTVQKRTGNRWADVKKCRTLAEAKEAACWIHDDMESDALRLA